MYVLYMPNVHCDSKAQKGGKSKEQNLSIVMKVKRRDYFIQLLAPECQLLAS